MCIAIIDIIYLNSNCLIFLYFNHALVFLADSTNKETI